MAGSNGGPATHARIGDDALRAKTGRSWAEWIATLDAAGARSMTHQEIASVLHEKFGVGPWWTQMVTVGYERIKGLRARGQRRNGSYETTKSRTFNVPVETLFDAWADPATRRRWLGEAGVKVRTATAPKSMRLGWPDGTIVAVWFVGKGESKSSVSVAHQKLPDRETANRLKDYWTEQLERLGKQIA